MTQPSFRVVVLCLALLTGGACAAPVDDEPTPMDCDAEPGFENSPVFELTGTSACGEQVFGVSCARCHGPLGQGSDLGPELGMHIVNHTDTELILVMAGGTGDMEDPEVDSQEMAHLLVWLRERFGDYNGEGH